MDALGLTSLLFTSSSNILGTAVVGASVDTAKRITGSVWSGLVNSFFTTAHFHPTDESYDWIIQWLEQCPGWETARTVEATTRDSKTDGQRVIFQPTTESTHTIWYRGYALRVKQKPLPYYRQSRNRRDRDEFGGGGYNDDEYESSSEEEEGDSGEPALSITILSHSNSHDILRDLVNEARKQYEAQTVEKVRVYAANYSWMGWRWKKCEAKRKRPIDSVILDTGVAEKMLTDTHDFLSSEDWYAQHGIPYRRSYLFYGPHGCGKKSMIHALASELGLDLHVVPLSSSGSMSQSTTPSGYRSMTRHTVVLSDEGLIALMQALPERCIVVLEGLDEAFKVTAPKPKKSSSDKDKKKTKSKARRRPKETPSPTLTLGGLLNALDGVTASEGRLLFATTTNLSNLDPALTRPGRMDIHIKFGLATKKMLRGLYKGFFDAFAPLEDSEDTDDLDSFQPSATVASSAAISTGPQPTPGLEQLSRQFAAEIPDGVFSMADVIGYLIGYRSRPEEAVKNIAAWVEKESASRATAETGSQSEHSDSSQSDEEEKEGEGKDKENAGDDDDASDEEAEEAAIPVETW